MKRVYTAESLIDGQMIVDLLAHNGVPSLLFNQNAQGGIGDLPVTYPEVWVKRDFDQSKARRMIADFETQPPPTSDLRCRRCSEWNPSTFEICWKCHGALA
ncbi:MAG: DUF2007 domain-containing protein [bacterium]